MIQNCYSGMRPEDEETRQCDQAVKELGSTELLDNVTYLNGMFPGESIGRPGIVDGPKAGTGGAETVEGTDEVCCSTISRLTCGSQME